MVSEYVVSMRALPSRPCETFMVPLDVGYVNKQIVDFPTGFPLIIAQTGRGQTANWRTVTQSSTETKCGLEESN